MNRRGFITYASQLGSSVVLQENLSFVTSEKRSGKKYKNFGTSEMQAEVIIIGGGIGGCAVALACCRNGLSVIMTEETDWIGGQLSQQGVPPMSISGLRHTVPRSRTGITETGCAIITGATIR